MNRQTEPSSLPTTQCTFVSLTYVILHMYTYIICTALMQIINTRNNRVQHMDNASPWHVPHHTFPSPQQISAYCQMTSHVTCFNICTCVPKKTKKRKRKALKWASVFDHICSHETHVFVIKNTTSKKKRRNRCSMIRKKSCKRCMSLYCNYK